MGYREDEKRWKRIQEMLAAEASGKVVQPVVSQRTLFGIPSTVEQAIERIVEEDERARREKRARASAARDDARRASGRLAFRELDASDDEAMHRMSALASSIVKEHFDPIIGPEQNDYMIERFQSAAALRDQLSKGYRYFFIETGDGNRDRDGRNTDARFAEGSEDDDSRTAIDGLDGDVAGEIGFIAYLPREDSLYISKFYLAKEYRGKGLAHEMLAFAIDAAKQRGLDSVTLNVNKRNDARLAYEKMGFRIIREEVNDIGNGFVMDDYVYELRLA